MNTFAAVVHGALEAEEPGGFRFLDPGVDPRQLSWPELARASLVRGSVLARLGLRAGDRIALIVPDNQEFVSSFLGSVAIGVVPVPLYPPLALGRLEDYIEATAGIVRASRVSHLVAPKRLQPFLWPVLDRVPSLRFVSVESLAAEKPPSQPGLPSVAPDDTVFLQYTSGSTANPKGVCVTHRSLLANCEGIMLHALRSTVEGDLGVSWLPMYHDMGLIGFVLAPFAFCRSVVFIPTLQFVKRPAVWMETIDRYRGTISFAPNFAFALAVDRTPPERVDALDLSCLRILGCGAEPIHPQALGRFVRHFERAKLPLSAILPCYGMAEATLAISFGELLQPFRTDRVRTDAYRSGGVAAPVKDEVLQSSEVMEFVSCGRPLPGHEVEVRSNAGQPLPERRVGEIVFRGPSAAAGYYEDGHATAEVFGRDGLHTGDLGYLADGELFVTGRQKDLLVIRGRNYDPQWVEWTVAEVPGVRKGNVAAFAIPAQDTERLVIAAETREEDTEAVRRAIRKQIETKLALEVSDVVCLGAGLLPKTSSGKLRRRETRLQYEEGILGRGGSRSVGGTRAWLSLGPYLISSLLARVRHFLRQRRSFGVGEPGRP